MIWFKRASGLDSETLRQAAQNVGVSWDEHPIRYKLEGVGYVNAEPTEADAIRAELENIIGYRPVVIDEPTFEE